MPRVRWPGRTEHMRRGERLSKLSRRSDRVQNGHITETSLSVTVSQSEVRRLAKLMARAEGAVLAANAAAQVAQSAQQALQQAVQDACGEEGVRIPADSNADINWKTGEITITPPGLTSSPPPMPDPASLPPPPIPYPTEQRPITP